MGHPSAPLRSTVRSALSCSSSASRASLCVQDKTGDLSGANPWGVVGVVSLFRNGPGFPPSDRDAGLGRLIRWRRLMDMRYYCSQVLTVRRTTTTTTTTRTLQSAAPESDVDGLDGLLAHCATPTRLVQPNSPGSPPKSTYRIPICIVPPTRCCLHCPHSRLCCSGPKPSRRLL